MITVELLGLLKYCTKAVTNTFQKGFITTLIKKIEKKAIKEKPNKVKIQAFFQVHSHSQLPLYTHHHCQEQRGPTELDTLCFQCHSEKQDLVPKV